MLEESTGNFSATRNIYDWYQDSSHVIINVMIKNLKETDVKVKLIDETLDVTCNLADGSEFRLHFNLFKPIYVAESSWSVTPSKLEIKLKKTDRKRWQSLEVIPTDKGHKRTATSASLGQHSNIIKRITTAIGQTNNSLTTSNIDNDDNTFGKKDIKYDWYQTNNEVKINVHIPNLNVEDVRIELTEKTLDCYITLPNGNEAKFNFNLFKPIYIEQSSWNVTLSKLEINLMKQEQVRWYNLESQSVEISLTNTNNANTSSSFSNNNNNNNNNNTASFSSANLNDDESNISAALIELSDSNPHCQIQVHHHQQQQEQHIQGQIQEQIQEHVQHQQVLLQNNQINSDSLTNNTIVVKTQNSDSQNDLNDQSSLNVNVNAAEFKDDKELAELNKVVSQFKEKEKKEEEKVLDGSVDELFREIYEKGGEEVRRAMSKSFNETGGLC